MDAIVVSSGAEAATLARALAEHGGAMVIAADGGLRAAAELCVAVDVVVGDFDSVDERQLAAAVARGAAIERHSYDKDATDLELAVHCAAARGATHVIVVDSTRGRLDHFLGTIGLLASPSLAGLDVSAFVDDASLYVMRGTGGAAEHAVHAAVGDTVTLLPVGGPALGITTKGMRYPLCDETLAVGTTRGVSNVVEQDDACVLLRDGVLLVVVPARTHTEGENR